MDDNDVKRDDRTDLGTFSFLQTGWWVLHIIAIIVVFYLGYVFGAPLFR